MAIVGVNQSAIGLVPALANPVVQARSRQIVMFYIMAGVMKPDSHDADGLLNLLGPESVPALVEGINFAAANQIGHC